MIRAPASTAPATTILPAFRARTPVYTTDKVVISLEHASQTGPVQAADAEARESSLRYPPICAKMVRRERRVPSSSQHREGIVNRIIQQLTSGVIAADIVETVSQRGVCYSLAVRRLDDETARLVPLFTCRSADLHDLIAVLDAANAITECLLDGGDPAEARATWLSATRLRVA